jgi:CRISPR-associated protein Csm2
MVDVTFYKGEKKTIRPELFSAVAEELAKDFSGEIERLNKRTQIRKFYDEVVRLNMLAKQSKDDWVDILPYLNMLIAKAAYARGRNLVSENFAVFIKNCIEQVSVPRDLDVFTSFFEAFMAFYRKYRPSN